MNKQYTKDSIKTYSDMEYIRLRPNNLLPSLDSQGIIHMLWEYISNSMDEIVQRPDGGTILVVLLRNPNTDDFQVVIRDNGRGLPNERVVDSYTKLKTSGKISENSAYVSTAGQFGMGAKAGVALSTHFRVISKHYLSSQVASLTMSDGKIGRFTTENVSISNGVTILIQPDFQQFFSQAKDFASTGYMDIVTLCKKLNVFNPSVNFNVFIVDQLLPEHIWNDASDNVIDTITQYINSENAHCEYSSEAVTDKSDYLFELWRTNSAIVFRDFYDKELIPGDKLQFGIRLFLSKKSATGNAQYFITINNVVLEDKSGNSATTSFINVFREIIANRIEDEKLKKFTQEEYIFPTMYLAIGIMYNGAQLGGTTKSTFRDRVFEEQFTAELKQYFESKSPEFYENLMGSILPDIQAKYALYYDVPAKKQDTQRIFVLLNFPRNYAECRSADNTKTELFLVEGTSAGNIISTRDNEFQAIYQTRGKPYNAATRPDQLAENRRRLLKDPIYQDIIKILHIDPDTTNINASRFNKIIIATDADPDGYHIRSLHINNLYIINPLIVTSGMVWLANPPLYSMQLTNSRYLFLRDKNALMDAKIKFIYKPSLDFVVKYNTLEGEKTIVPDDNLYRDICYLITHIGEKFKLAAQQLNIPLFILERLFYATKHLFPVVNYQELKKYFLSSDGERYVGVDYDSINNSLIVSIGNEDYPIGLSELGEMFVNHLLPLDKKYKYSSLFFAVKGKMRTTRLKEYQPASPMQLYTCFTELDRIVTVHRYKGLGEMPTESCASTIMNPQTRALTQVTDVGDYVDNYGLLGRDSTVRKQLLSESGSLAASFMQQHNRLWR